MNRVGDRYFDQLVRNGHDRRPDDIVRIAGLGIRAVRYPVLWERTAPAGLEAIDWRWPDERLGLLRAHGLRPIVGLLHHGSGPRDTSLVDPAFPRRLADYAARVAERYPWVEDWTPVNEPLTTARFSGLYGHWYPHGRDERTFARALVGQCQAVAAAMRAIRSAIPGARLIQTEDLAKVHSTPALRHQAAHENERRWLTFDLLCGRVGPEHPLWGPLVGWGIDPGELEAFVAEPTPPDVLGIDHYVTSERFLDERLERYPAEWHGGNGREAYADLIALRVLERGVAGPTALLLEAWERYGLPLAVTEAHLGGPRDEQLRWLATIWAAARRARQQGADVRAVTAWALLGSWDWNRLVTELSGHYEPGPFDSRSGRARPTALARQLAAYARGDDFDHPTLDAPAWWERRNRLQHPPVRLPGPSAARRRRRRPAPLVVLGDGSPLAAALLRVGRGRGLSVRRLPRSRRDDAAQIAAALHELQPWAVVVVGPVPAVAERLVDVDRPLMLLAAPGPAVDLGPAGLTVSAASSFGPWDGRDRLARALVRLAAGDVVRAPDDQTQAPAYLPDLAHVALDLLIDGERGHWRVAHAGAQPWPSLIARAAEAVGLDASLVQPLPAAPARRGPRPAEILPTLEDALARYVRERRPTATAC